MVEFVRRQELCLCFHSTLLESKRGLYHFWAVRNRQASVPTAHWHQMNAKFTVQNLQITYIWRLNQDCLWLNNGCQAALNEYMNGYDELFWLILNNSVFKLGNLPLNILMVLLLSSKNEDSVARVLPQASLTRLSLWTSLKNQIKVEALTLILPSQHEHFRLHQGKISCQKQFAFQYMSYIYTLWNIWDLLPFTALPESLRGLLGSWHVGNRQHKLFL